MEKVGLPWWLRIHQPSEETRVGSLMREDPIRLNPCTTATEAGDPQSLCSTIREATAMRNLSTAARE